MCVPKNIPGRVHSKTTFPYYSRTANLHQLSSLNRHTIYYDHDHLTSLRTLFNQSSLLAVNLPCMCTARSFCLLHLSNIYCSGLLLIEEEEDDCFFVFIFIHCVPIVFLLDHHIIIKIIIITKREGVPSGKMNETIVVYFMIGQKILNFAFHCRSL